MNRGTWGVLVAVLAAATLVCFSPVLENGFVWDDGANIVQNPHLERLDGALVVWSFTDFRLGHYQPFTWISLALDRAIWGLRASGFHLTSLLLHALNAMLFALLARWLLAAALRPGIGPATDGDPDVPDRSGSFAIDVGALVAAAVFALHPMRVESVAWATERRDLLAGLFAFGSLLAYRRMVERDAAGGRRAGWGALALALFVGSLFSKALALGLPFVLLVLDFYPLRRSGAGAGQRSAGALVVEKIPFLLVSLPFGASALAAQSDAGALIDLAGHGWVQRLVQAAYGALFYPRAMLSTAWSPLYERPTVLDPTEPRFVVSSIAAVAVTLVLFLFRRRFPAGLAVWLGYLVLLAPVSGIAQSGVQLVADRYAYLAGSGFALLLGGGAAIAWSATAARTGRRLLAAGFVALLALWGGLSWRQSRVWRDDTTLWQHVLKFGPSAMASNNLGAIALQQGASGTALAYFRRAVEIAPSYGLPWKNVLALLEGDTSRLDREELRRTAEVLERSLPNHAAAAAAWTTVALCRMAAGENDTALERLERAVEVNPAYRPAWRWLAKAQWAAGRFSDCARSYSELVRLEPGSAVDWTGLGLCYQAAGELGYAEIAFARSLAIEPSAETARRLAELRSGAPR
ncbi:MAG: tetratricopeptide repeat protein [Thermoanaerobaculia bacterium]